MKLRRNEFCPIHRSLFCCGREQARKERRFQLGVQRIEDPHHPVAQPDGRAALRGLACVPDLGNLGFDLGKLRL